MKPAAAPPDGENWKPGWRLQAAFIAIAIVNLATALDATIISVALPVITVALKGNAIEAFWAGTSFLLTSTVWQPNFVTFSDLWGRRPLLLFAITLFTVGSIVCATAQNFTSMLVGRSIQGSGGGGILSLSEIIITDIVPLRQRGNYFAGISMVWAIGSVAGPLVGGALATKGAWRWIFYLNLPIVAIGFAAVIAFLKLEHRPRTLKEKLRKIDYVGSSLFIASLTSFLIAITWGGVQFAWDSWRTLVPLLVGLAGLAVFLVYEAKFTTVTLLPLRIFKSPSTSLAYYSTFIHGIVLWAILYYMPIFFEGSQNYTPIQAGLTALPQSLTVVPCAAIVGVVSAKTNTYRWAVWIGWFLATLGCGLLYILSPTTSIPGWIFLLLVSGLGIGLLFPSMALAIQASAPVKDIAIAAAMFTFFRCFGQTVGVAIGGVVFQNRMQANLAAYPSLSESARAYSLDVVALVRTINHLPENDPQAAILKQALSDSIGTIWAVVCGLAGSALISSLFIRHFDLNQALQTEQGFEGQQKEKNKLDEAEVAAGDYPIEKTADQNNEISMVGKTEQSSTKEEMIAER